MSEWPTLKVTIRRRIGNLTLDVDFRASKPWTVLFAPSGAGKTTVLRTIAGLERAQYARIVWTDAESVPCVLADTGKGKFTPAYRRCLPMVMQSSALFPHITVEKNVAYGFRGDSNGVSALLQLCRIEPLAGKMPAQLSGGERQRVAIARALGAGGKAVLLDEPFAGIDGTVKDDLMRDVKSWLAMTHTPVLHVTHDVGEVFAVADEVIRLRDGRVIGQGPPEVMLLEERERLVGLLGR